MHSCIWYSELYGTGLFKFRGWKMWHMHGYCRWQRSSGLLPALVYTFFPILLLLSSSSSYVMCIGHFVKDRAQVLSSNFFQHLGIGFDALGNLVQRPAYCRLYTLKNLKRSSLFEILFLLRPYSLPYTVHEVEILPLCFYSRLKHISL